MAQITESVLIAILFSTPIFGGQLNNTFAHYLEKIGDNKNAIVEYERLALDSTSEYNADSLHLKLARLYMKLQLFNRAREELDYLPESKYINNLKGVSYLLEGKFAESRKYISNDTLKGISYFLQNRFNMANNYIRFNSIPKRKHAFIGAVLSSIIPGSGKFYAGRSYDGIYSFLLTISPAISSYYYFHKGNKTMGYIYASISGLFYLGNIYGSYKACEIYNRYQFDIYKREELLRLQFTKWF